MKIVFHFLLSLVVYAILDLLFINLFAKNFIKQQVGEHMAAKPDLVAAGIFYLIFVAGVLYFCVYPADNAQKALFNGAFFGLVTYATYELVNKSLLANWPWPLVGVDIAWGVFVGAALSFASFKIGGLLNV